MRFAIPGRPILASQLPLPDRLLLWTVRAWVIGLKERRDTREPIQVAFGKFNIPEAADLLDTLMSVVACGAARPLIVECVCHEVVSEDEGHLLAAAALHQDGRGLEARFMLRTMLSPKASADAGQILDRLGAIFAVAGLKLFGCPAETERYVLGPTHSDEKVLSCGLSVH
jgi:hypothetical protein